MNTSFKNAEQTIYYVDSKADASKKEIINE